MSIFDTFASVLRSSNTSASRFATQALDLLKNQPGGLPGRARKFRDCGYDDAVRSWVGTGANLGITKEAWSVAWAAPTSTPWRPRPVCRPTSPPGARQPPAAAGGQAHARAASCTRART